MSVIQDHEIGRRAAEGQQCERQTARRTASGRHSPASRPHRGQAQDQSGFNRRVANRGVLGTEQGLDLRQQPGSASAAYNVEGCHLQFPIA